MDDVNKNQNLQQQEEKVIIVQPMEPVVSRVGLRVFFTLLGLWLGGGSLTAIVILLVNALFGWSALDKNALPVYITATIVFLLVFAIGFKLLMNTLRQSPASANNVFYKRYARLSLYVSAAIGLVILFVLIFQIIDKLTNPERVFSASNFTTIFISFLFHLGVFLFSFWLSKKSAA